MSALHHALQSVVLPSENSVKEPQVRYLRTCWFGGVFEVESSCKVFTCCLMVRLVLHKHRSNLDLLPLHVSVSLCLTTSDWNYRVKVSSKECQLNEISRSKYGCGCG